MIRKQAMNCEMAQQAIALAHGELDVLPGEAGSAQDPALSEEELEQRLALAQHLEACPGCREEWAFYQALAGALGDAPTEPSPSLVARARARLDFELDVRPTPGPFSRFLLNLSFGAGRLRAAPVLTSSLIFLGLLAGTYTGYQAGRRAHIEEQVALLTPPPSNAADPAPIRVAAVTGITRGTDPEAVLVHYDRLVPDSLPGSLDDPLIRSLLLLGARNADDASVRSDAIALLAGECRNGHQCDGDDHSASPATQQAVLSTLLASLRSDREPQVRLSALHGLEPFVARDVRVRNAVLEALMSDPDNAVRTQALRMLPSGAGGLQRAPGAAHGGQPRRRSRPAYRLAADPRQQPAGPVAALPPMGIGRAYPIRPDVVKQVTSA